MTFNIQQDTQKSRFYIVLDGQICDLKYRQIDPRTLDYYSTYVPESLRGQGIAGQITDFALAYAKSHQYQVIPSCPYVKQYIEMHPQYKILVQSNKN